MSQVSITNDDPCLEHNLKGHKKAVNGLAFHPVNKQLASCSSDNSVMLWNFTTKNIRCYDFKAHTDVVTSVEFTSNGRLMGTCSQDQTVRLWIPAIKGGSTDFRAHGAPIRTISFSPDDEQLITGSNDKSIKIWNVQYRQFLSSLLGHTNWVQCARYSPDGKVIASCGDDKTMRIWDTASGQCIHTFMTTKGTGNYLDFHRTGNSLALALSNGSIRVYDIRNNKLQQHYVLHENTKCVLWHPSANYFLSCGIEGTIKITDAMEGRPVYTLKAHEGPINAVRFSPNGDYFVSAGADKHVMLWLTNFISNLSNGASSTTSSSSQEDI